MTRKERIKKDKKNRKRKERIGYNTIAKKQIDLYKGPDLWLAKICRYINKKSKSFWKRFIPLEFADAFIGYCFRPDDVWIDVIKKIIIIFEVEERRVTKDKNGKRQENGAPPSAFNSHCWNLLLMQRLKFPDWKVIAIDIAISPHIDRYKQKNEKATKDLDLGLAYHLIPSWKYGVIRKEVYEILQSY